MKKFADLLVTKRYWFALFSVSLFILVAVGFKNFGLTADYRSFFDKDNEQVLAFEKMQQMYAKNDSILLVIEPKDGNLFSKRYLKLVEDMTDRAWYTPYVKRVDSLANFQHTAVEDDTLDVQYLIEDSQDMSEQEIEERKAIAIAEPELINRIVSSNGAITAININTDAPGTNISKETPEIVSFVREMVDEFKVDYPDVNFRLVGSIMLSNAFPEAAKANNKLYGIMFAVMIILLTFIYRSVLGALASLVIMALSAGAGLGAIAWFGIKLTPVGLSAPIMILTLAVAHCIHIFGAYYQKLSQEQDVISALTHAVRNNIKPILIASGTTAVGFLSQNFSESPPFRTLGNMVAIGVIFSAIFSLCLLPLLISWLPSKARNIKSYSTNMLAFAEVLIQYKKSLFIGSLTISVVLISFIFMNVLDENNLDHFSESIQFRQDIEFVNDNLTGVKVIAYSISAEGADGVTDPAYLSKLAEFSQWFRDQGLVVHVSTFSDTMKRLNRDMNGGEESFYLVPENRELAAQYLLLYEMFLPLGLDLTNRVNINRSATQLVVTVEKATNQSLYQLDLAAQNWLKNNAPEYMWSEGLGQNMMFVHNDLRNVNSMLKGLFTGLLVISIILMLIFKSIRIGLISLVPNIFPALIAFGIWGLFVGQVGIGLSLVMGMTLGIVVDDTVHFLIKYLDGRKNHNLNADEAVKYAFEQCGSALIITTIVICSGFLVLAFSSFALSADMGVMTALTVFIALIIDFILLPTLLMLVDTKVVVSAKSEIDLPDNERYSKAS